MTQDNRNFERIEKFFIVNIKPSGFTANYYFGLTKNICMDGFSFESQNYDLKVGDCLEFELKDPGGGLNLTAAGKIVWEKATDFECIAGVQFLMLDDDARRHIMDNVPEYQQVNEHPPVDEEESPVPIKNKEEKPVGTEAEGIISQAFSRIADGLGADESGIDERAATYSLDERVGNVTGTHIEQAAFAFPGAVEANEPEPDNDVMYRAHLEIDSDKYVMDRAALQGGEWEKANRNYLYIAAVSFFIVIASAIFFIYGTGNREDEPPVHAAVQEYEQDPRINNRVQEELSEQESPGSAFLMEADNSQKDSNAASEQFLISPEKVKEPHLNEQTYTRKSTELKTVDTNTIEPVPNAKLPISDKTRKKPIVVEEQPLERTSLEISEKVSEKSFAQREPVNIPQPVQEGTAVSETPVNESTQKKLDVNRGDEELKNAASESSSYNNIPEQDVEIAASDKVLDETVMRMNVQTIDAMAADEKRNVTEESRTLSIQKSIDRDERIEPEKSNAVIPEDKVEDGAVSETEKITDEDLLPSTEEMVNQNYGLSVSSSQNGFTIFQDNFDDNTGNWEQFQTNAASAQIKGGEYYLKNKRDSGSHLVFSRSDLSFDSDFLIEVDIRPVTSSGSYAYGLVFGARNAFDNYTFHIINNTAFSIKQNQKGVVSELASGTLNNIYSNQHNTLRVAGHGNKIRFFINGTYVAGIPDLPIVGGKWGFIIDGQSAVAVDRYLSRVTSVQ